MNTGIGDAVNLAWKIADVVQGHAISQISVHYRDSGLSEGRAGDVHDGDRLPWVPASQSDLDNFTPLTSISWQVHVYGEATRSTQTACDERALPLHVFPWRPLMGRAGLQRNAVYLIRPDGYVAFADAGGSGAAMTSYLDARKFVTSPRRSVQS